jgi:hypothetical protein
MTLFPMIPLSVIGLPDRPERTRPMRRMVYLSAASERQEELRRYRSALEKQEWTVTSSWLDEWMRIDYSASQLAVQDVADIYACDVFVAFADGQYSRGGRHVELGVALALGKFVICVGPKEHLFHSHPSIMARLDDTSVLLPFIGGMSLVMAPA